MFYVKAYRANGLPTVNDAREYDCLDDAMGDAHETARGMLRGSVVIFDDDDHPIWKYDAQTRKCFNLQAQRGSDNEKV